MAVEDCETNATEVLVIMLSSLGYWFVNKIKASVQSQLISIALTECKKFGLLVMSITCDGAHVNSSTMQILGCDLNQKYDNINCSFKITPTGSTIHYTPDACHNVKLARNALGDLKVFRDECDCLIEWKFIEELF